jgi:hypothetical protein
MSVEVSVKGLIRRAGAVSERQRIAMSVAAVQHQGGSAAPQMVERRKMTSRDQRLNIVSQPDS